MIELSESAGIFYFIASISVCVAYAVAAITGFRAALYLRESDIRILYCALVGTTIVCVSFLLHMLSWLLREGWLTHPGIEADGWLLTHFIGAIFIAFLHNSVVLLYKQLNYAASITSAATGKEVNDVRDNLARMAAPIFFMPIGGDMRDFNTKTNQSYKELCRSFCVGGIDDVCCVPGAEGARHVKRDNVLNGVHYGVYRKADAQRRS